MSSSPLLEIRPERRAKRRAEVEEEEDPIDPLVQAQQMEERTRDLMARQEEARTRRQLLRMRAELEREIRESEIPPSVDVSSEEEATEKPTEEPTEKPTEEPAEEPTEKPTEELAEEPTEKPTKELAKEDGESDEDAWGRWRWPTGDASASWHGTTSPMEPPEGPSVDALGRQKERDAATSRDGPTTVWGGRRFGTSPRPRRLLCQRVVQRRKRRSRLGSLLLWKRRLWKKRLWKKRLWQRRLWKRCPRPHLQERSSFETQRIQELFQTFGPEEAGDLPVEDDIESSSPTVDLLVVPTELAVPTEPAPTTVGSPGPPESVPEQDDMESSSPTVDLLVVPTEPVVHTEPVVPTVPTEPAPTTVGSPGPPESVPEQENAGGEAKKKKGKRKKKKASQARAGDVFVVEEDPAESAGGVGDISAESAGGRERRWCGRHQCRERRWRWRHRCGERWWCWRHRCGERWWWRCEGCRPEEAEEKERSSQNSSCGGASRRRGGAGAGAGAAYPRSFSAYCTFGCGSCGCGPDGCGCAADSRSKAEAVSRSSGSCASFCGIAGATVAATAPRACGSVRPTCYRSSSRSTAFWSQSLGIKPGAEALGFRVKGSVSRATKGSASRATKGGTSRANKEGIFGATKGSSSQKGARAFSVNLMLGYPRVSVFARKSPEPQGSLEIL